VDNLWDIEYLRIRASKPYCRNEIRCH